MATNITYFTNMILCDLVCYMKHDIRKTYTFPDRRMFQDLGVYLRIGLPQAVTYCLEWWAFELLAIFSGLINVEQLAAEVVVLNLVTFIFMISQGTSYAASALTGYFLCEGNINMARKYASLCVLYSTVLTVFIIVLLRLC